MPRGRPKHGDGDAIGVWTCIEVRRRLYEENVTVASKHMESVLKAPFGNPLPGEKLSAGSMQNLHRKVERRRHGDPAFDRFLQSAVEAKLRELSGVPPGTFEILPLRLKTEGMGDAHATVVLGVELCEQAPTKIQRRCP
jgi:hypothetical protein